jgi:hypothetical protein
VAFSITLGVSFWQQRRSRPPDPVAVTVPDAHTEEPIVQAPPRAAVTTGAAVVQSQSAPAAIPAAAAAAASEPPPSPFSAIEVPAFVLLGSTTEQSGREATLRNSSARSLEVSVTANNPRTGHQAAAQLSLAPFQRINLADAGFRVESGDVLTLSSPPFRDREIDVEAEAN